jgi:chemotaxis response regulator CheB
LVIYYRYLKTISKEIKVLNEANCVVYGMSKEAVKLGAGDSPIDSGAIPRFV